MATGKPLAGDLIGATDYAAAIARTHGDKKALFDLLATEVSFTEEERGAIATHAMKALHAFERVAVVTTAGKESREEDSVERAAGHVRMFRTLVEAKNWLSGKPKA